MAFSGFWAVILLTFGGLGKPQTLVLTCSNSLKEKDFPDAAEDGALGLGRRRCSAPRLSESFAVPCKGSFKGLRL